MRVITLADKVTILNAVGIDIDEASKRVQLDKLVLSQLPSTVETAAA